MKAIVKALKKKQAYSHVVLCILITLTLLSIQVSAMVFSRNDSVANRISEMKVAHTILTGQSLYKDQGLYPYLDDYMEETKDFTYEKTFLYPRYSYPLAHMYREYPIVLEGYVKSDANYPLIKGKKMSSLKGNEIAIMKSYADELENSGINPIGHKISLPNINYEGLNTFTVKSIFEYPNFEESYARQNDGTKSASAIFERNVSSIGIVNKNTLSKMYDEFASRKLPNTQNRKINLISCAAKIHFKEYSVNKEKELRENMVNDYYHTSSVGDNDLDMNLLVDEMNMNKVILSIFKFISLSVSMMLSFSCFFVFYAYMKKQLLEDKEKLSIMSASGILKRNIAKAYSRIYSKLFMISVVSWIFVTFIFVGLIQWVAPYEMKLLFQINFKTLGLASVCAIMFFGFINLMLNLQIQSTLRGTLMNSIRKGQLYLSSKSKPISYKRQIFHLAWRDLKSRPFTTLRGVMSLSIVIMSIALLVSTFSLLTHLYNKDTYGLKFDYLLTQGVKFDDFKELDGKYFKDFAFIEDGVNQIGINHIYLTDEKSGSDPKDTEYYPGMILTITGKLDNFLPLKKGEYPPEAKIDEGGDGSLYMIQKTMVPRRIAYDFDRGIYKDDLYGRDALKGYITYNYGSGWNASKQIHGFTESIVNNGYIIFANVKMMDVDKDHYKQMPLTILNLKDKSQAKVFEKELKHKGIEYDTFDSMMKEMQKKNDEVNERLFYIMFIVLGLSLITLVITLRANIKADIAEKEEENLCLEKIGVAHYLIQKKEIIRQLILIAFAIIVSFILYAIIQIPFFSILKIYLGLYKLPSYSPNIFIILVIIVVISLLLAYFLSKKKKMSQERF